MLNKIRSQIGIRLFAILTIIIVMSIVPLTFITFRAINHYELEAAETNEVKIRSQAFSYLKEITSERAHRYQAFFDRIAASAGMTARLASMIYSDLDYYSSRPLENYQYRLYQQNWFWMNSIENSVLSLYWGGSKLGPDAKRELLALTNIHPLLKQALAENPEALASHVIAISGLGQYYTETLEVKKSVFYLPPASDFDLRHGEPMTIFTKSEDLSPGVRWTRVYKDDVIDGLMLTASASIIDNKGVFRGITGIDVPLQNLLNDILGIEDENWVEGSILFSFLLDENNEVIAIPGAYYSLFGLNVDSSKLVNSADILGVDLATSNKKDVRDLASSLIGKEKFFTEINHDGRKYMVVTHRMPDLGWVFGVVVKEDDILLSIQESRIGLKRMIGDVEIKGIILSLLTMSIAIVVMFIAIRYLILPLRVLTDATRKVAAGDLTAQCPVTTTDEVGVLARSFNSMVKQLRIAQEKQEKYSQSLESEVEDRNVELDEQRDQLEVTLNLLGKEIERRQIISEALKTSEQQYFDTLEATTAGVYIVEGEVFTYVNSSFADMIGTTSKELVDTVTFDIVHKDDRSLVAENAALRLAGEIIPPYSVRWLRTDGTQFHGEVWGKIANWQGRIVMVGTITDVTETKYNEERLKLQDKQLQRSLDEKEVLLKEIYHRTKNNMLVIISLLDLQTQDIEDDKVRAVFLETESRIRAMALVHEKLYQSKNLSDIDLGEYLQEVTGTLLKNMVVEDRIKLVLSHIEPLSITIDYAVPLGLVVNEIVTNSIKHGFPDNRFGTVYLSLKTSGTGDVVLTVGDDGIGLPVEMNVDEAASFGMRIIIKSLIKLQLRGTVTVDREYGTSYNITFPEPADLQRV